MPFSTVCHQVAKPLLGAIAGTIATTMAVFSFGGSAIASTINPGELNLSGITLNTSETEIYNILGSPKSRDIGPTSYIDEILYFGGISIAVSGGMVWDIVATSPKFCTPSGVCPGDSVDLLFDTLGPTALIPAGGRQRAIYAAPSMGCSLNLDIVANTVSQIELACQ